MSWPLRNEPNSSGEWGRGGRNKLRTHAHIRARASEHARTHTHAQAFQQPTDKCTTLSHYSPINICTVSANSCETKRTENRATANISPRPPEDAEGTPHRLHLTSGSRSRSDGTYLSLTLSLPPRLPQSQYVSCARRRRGQEE